MIERLLPSDFAVVCGDPRRMSVGLFAQEERIVEHAVAKRQREFAKGRECARRALEAFGIVGFPLLAGPQRDPLWPESVVGSITHTDTFCAAAVASKRAYRGVGIDVEPDEPLSDELTDSICHPDELVTLGPQFASGMVTRLIFSAKEAFYKCQYPLTRAFLDFKDMRTKLHSDGTFHTRVVSRAPSNVGSAQGRWLRSEGLVATAVWLRQ